MIQFREKFKQSCKDVRLPVEIIEINKKQFYIQNKNDYQLIEENIEVDIKTIVSIIRRFKEKDNNDEIEKGNFEIKNLGSIYESIEKLEKISSDNPLREIKEKP